MDAQEPDALPFHGRDRQKGLEGSHETGPQRSFGRSRIHHHLRALQVVSKYGCFVIEYLYSYPEKARVPPNSDVAGANLQDANFNSVNLAGARLTGVKLKGTSLQGVTLENYNFYSANFKGINLKDAYLQNIKLDGANLQAANFSKTRLEDVAFFNANLERAQFHNTQGLTRNAIWKTANWIFAYFDTKTLEALDLPADFQAKIQNKNLSGMNLQTVYFRDFDLQDLNFHRADLQGARFERVGLQDVNFSQANLNKVKMRNVSGRVNLTRADLQQASIDYSDLVDTNFQEANLKRARLTEVDLRNANLAQANLRGITFGNWVKIDGANLEGADLSSSHIMNARGLTCEQLQQAIVDINTSLPKYLSDCRQ